MLGTFQVLDQARDVIEIDAGPKSQIFCSHGEGSGRLARAMIQADPESVIDHAFDRLTGAPSLAPDKAHNVVFERQGCSLCHIKKFNP